LSEKKNNKNKKINGYELRRDCYNIDGAAAPVYTQNTRTYVISWLKRVRDSLRSVTVCEKTIGLWFPPIKMSQQSKYKREQEAKLTLRKR